VPTKKAPIHAPCYLEPEELKAILAQPRSLDDRRPARPCAPLVSLTIPAPRIQEALDVAHRNPVRLSPACVRLYGKAEKKRLSPLWPETVFVTQIATLLRRQPMADDEPIFVNRYGVPARRIGRPLQTGGVRQGGSQNRTSLASKRVTPHSFRHATAVHLVAAGVDVTVIRSWLGHVSLDTTNHYAQANLETKRLALERLESPSQPAKRPSWKQDQSVLAWLDTL